MLGSMSITHWMVVILVVAILFGRNRISSTMADIGKGIGNMKRGLAEARDLDRLPGDES